MHSALPIAEGAAGRRPWYTPSGLRELGFRRARSFRERLCLEEVSGSLGDLGTLIPLLAGCAKLGSIRMGPAVFWMGAFNVVSGLQWDLPMPVQPMKSIAAVAISGGLSPGAFAAAGILTGAAVLLLGLTQTIDLASRAIPRSVIAGMQVGLGVRMAAQGCSYWHGHGWLDGVDSKLTCLTCFLLALLLMLRTRLPTALIIFAVGLVLALVRIACQGSELAFGLLEFPVVLPRGREWLDGLLDGALPQLPLTALNSVISVCALSGDLFGKPEEGGRGASRVSVASSVGLMNVLGCWFGGMPSCHGAGGLAGQYRFGARGGLSVVMLGSAKMVLALGLGETLNVLVESYPTTVLGVLLLFAGVELASVGARSLRSPDSPDEDLLPCFATAGAYVGTRNMALGVCAGLLAASAQRSDGCWEALGRAAQPKRCGVPAAGQQLAGGSAGTLPPSLERADEPPPRTKARPSPLSGCWRSLAEHLLGPFRPQPRSGDSR